jgi:hypothetical protein
LSALAALDAADGRLDAAEILLSAAQHAAAAVAEQGGHSNAAGDTHSVDKRHIRLSGTMFFISASFLEVQ